MAVQKLETLPPPPGVIGSLRAGFDVVANRVALILLPLGLDLFLWLGPRLNISALFAPYVRLVFEQARFSVAEADLDRFNQYQLLVTKSLQDFNLLSLLSKLQLFPIGISSLAAQTLPPDTPFGAPYVIVLSSFWIVLGLMAVLIPLGWIGGGVYFRQVAVSVVGGDEAGISVANAVLQSLLLSIIWLIGMVILFVPLTFGIGLLALVSPSLANFAMFILMFLFVWLIVPLFFTPHGIFVRRQNAFLSIYSSLRLSRFTFPTSGLFVLSAFLLSRGLDLLWSAPKSDQWLTLVGFAGHAFITTVLLAASFIYYRDMTDWLKNAYERFRQLGQSSP
ncbi:MAG: hypothetical protein ACOYYF_15815 [Chloroflexota bacterium]|nr:hypothetical protein [Chloroflexota bacterium]MBI5704781.1 hypothetical protein [Chloroflexota bacterium]